MSLRSRLSRLVWWLGAATALVIGLVVIAAAVRCVTRDAVADHTVLELDLERRLVEHVSEDPLVRLLSGGDAQGLDALVAALERAAADERVDGVVARIGGAEHAMATTQELRDAILALRRRGKFAIAYAETFGEVGPGSRGYYLATAFEEIWLQPSGDVGLTGPLMESMFLAGTLELAGAAPRMDHRREYKNAKNMFTERGYTAAHREAMEGLAEAMHRQLTAGIAEARGLTPEQVAALIDRGPFLGAEAVEAGLVDRLGYRDQVMAAVQERTGGAGKLLYAQAYLERAGRPHDEGAKVALIFAEGSVSRGASSFDPIFGGPTMGSDTVAGALRAAIADKDVRAIVLRVNSPGGSYVASDAIWRETVRAGEAGKPVIVSMGDVAASGGYFIATHAHTIVAHPGTITGSIGVLGGKILTRSLWERLGVSWDAVHRGDNARMWSNLHDYSAPEWERFQAWLDRVYSDFSTKVAEGRKMDAAAVEAVARGRVWAGDDAQARGLVDALGGYAVALRSAREAAGLAADAAIEVVVFPREKGLLGALMERRESSEAPARVEAAAAMIRELRPVAAELRRLGFGPGSHGVLSTPPIEFN
jgi:protease-4